MNKTIEWMALGVFLVALLFGATYFFPWRDINWGRVTMEPVRTVTVSGTAESKVKNQIAKFSAGVQATNDNRDAAIKETNDKISKVTEAVKLFGVDAADIITQSLSVYQMQQTVYEDNQPKQKPGQWSVSNTIEVTLRDVDKASQLADILSKNGATNVYGPSLQLDTTKRAEDQLTTDAIADARKKAEVIAASGGAKLGQVISVAEGFVAGPIYGFAMERGGAGGGGGTPIQPGSGTVSKTMTVVWALE